MKKKNIHSTKTVLAAFVSQSDDHGYRSSCDIWALAAGKAET